MPIWSMAPATDQNCPQARQHLSRVVNRQPLYSCSWGKRFSECQRMRRRLIIPCCQDEGRFDFQGYYPDSDDSATQPVDSAALESAMENLNVKDLWKPVY